MRTNKEDEDERNAIAVDELAAFAARGAAAQAAVGGLVSGRTCGVCLDGLAVELFSVRKVEDDRFFIHNRPACRKCMRVVLTLLGPIDELEIFEGSMP